jgi:hypothetical protein
VEEGLFVGFLRIVVVRRLEELAGMGEVEGAAEVFAPRVQSVTPPHGPREGGTVLLIRGTGFGSRRDEIAAMIGG